MSTWKTDPVVRLIFAEIDALWKALAPETRPLLLRVEQRPDDGRAGACDGRLANIWLFDDHGARLAPILRREPHDFGPDQAGYHRYGLIEFAVCADLTGANLRYRFGPLVGGELDYAIEHSEEHGTALIPLTNCALR